MSPRRLVQTLLPALLPALAVGLVCLPAPASQAEASRAAVVADGAEAEGSSGTTVAGGDGATSAEAADEAGASEPTGARRASASPLPPVGVRLGNALEGNTLRIGYSWERLRSQGLMTNDDDRSPDFVRSLGYTSTLRSLETTIHTVEVAYAPHPRVTLVAEVPFIQKEIERVDFATPGACNGVRCQHQSEGVGDVRFAMIVPFIRKGFESSQVHIGFDVPTGSIRRQGGTPIRLPYLAQIGNGTVDFEWGWTYHGALDRFSWGGQALGRHPLARNGLDYREGSHFTGRIWGAVRLFAGLDLSFRADWEKQNEIEGFDRGLRPTVDPSEDAELYERVAITLAPGVSFVVPSLAGQRVGIEVGVPVYQDVDGPQLERDWSIKTAWRWIY